LTRTILGISAFYHDSAAALVRDGVIVAAAQEERFSRKKHDPRFPRAAINYCLEEAFIEQDDLDAIVFYDSPLLTWDRIVRNCLEAGEAGADQFAKAARSTLGVKMWAADYVRNTLGTLGKTGRLLHAEHHMSHAASAFYPSPWEDAAIVTVDGVGEWATTTIGMGRGNAIDLLWQINYPHSVGLLYSAFTYFCGFKVNSGEYKLMGLAPYGRPTYKQLILDKLVDLRPDGSIRLDMGYFGYLDSLVMTNPRFDALFGGPPRQPESPITRREMDIAASIQAVTEEVMLRMARFARRETGARHCTFAGGVALNCVANGHVLREKIFDDIWIQPAAGDAGGALGAALLATHARFGLPRAGTPDGRDRQHGSYLGPAFRPAEVRSFLDRRQIPYECIPDLTERSKRVAAALADGKVVGFLSGRMEFGPRALGARSILGDPRRADTQATMNLKIKFRESFRPFAPSCLAEDVAEYFEHTSESPYMLLVAPVRKERRRNESEAEKLRDVEDMLHVINQVRSDIPAVTHVDFSARIQTVNEQDQPAYYELLRQFKALTGYGVLVNSSFNVRGEPIVCTPQDAWLCFMRTEMDLLVLEDHLLWKASQPPWEDKEDWRTLYELD
jgi:carbamoyltransferase